MTHVFLDLKGGEVLVRIYMVGFINEKYLILVVGFLLLFAYDIWYFYYIREPIVCCKMSWD